MTLKLNDADLQGVDVTVVKQDARFLVYTPYYLMSVTPEELSRFAMTILKDLGVAPVSEKWSERG